MLQVIALLLNTPKTHPTESLQFKSHLLASVFIINKEDVAFFSHPDLPPNACYEASLHQGSQSQKIVTWIGQAVSIVHAVVMVHQSAAKKGLQVLVRASSFNGSDRAYQGRRNKSVVSHSSFDGSQDAKIVPR